MFKDRLRAARKSAGMTQKEVASAIGITESAYCGYETGKRQPDPIKISSIASVLGVSGDYLLETGYENKTAPSAEDDALLQYFHQLNNEGQEQVLNYARLLVNSNEYKKYDPAQLGQEA